MTAQVSETILDGEALDRVLSRLAHEIVDAIPPEELAQLAVVGIRTGGAHLASRLAARLGALRGHSIAQGALDITLYRDDVLVGARAMPVLRGTDIAFDVEGRTLLLVDDVLFTGRTIRAALDALLDLGRPRAVRLAVLVDRGLRELPIAADFVGRAVRTETQDRVEVTLTESGAARDAVILHSPANHRANDR